MANLPRYTELTSFQEVSEWARDVLDYLEAQPTLTELTTRIIGGDTFALAVDRATPPRAVLVVRAEEVGSPGTLATPTAPPVWTWRKAPGETRGEVLVTSVAGLTSSTQYDLRLLVVG